MSIKEMSNYTFYAKYAKYNHNKQRRETWNETVDRVFDMHKRHLGDKIENEELSDYLELAKTFVKQKKVLGAQRALQFGGDPILKKNPKIYNCSATYVDRARSFQEIMYLLMNGCGVGISVQKHHIEKLPSLIKNDESQKPLRWVIDDSIEGWADAIGVIMYSYFDIEQDEFEGVKGRKIDFDYSKIRPEGAYISGGFTAPGPNGLQRSINLIETLLKTCIDNGYDKLRPIDAYDILMHCSDAVLSGGIRRAALITLFSKDDEDMLKSKTGDWFHSNPQRGRSNNSVVIKRNEITKEEFDVMFENVKEFGEPGFIYVDDYEQLINPCAEISIWAHDEITGESGVGFCNLCEINMKKAKTEEDFYSACKAAAIIGTIQASYTNFEYLTQATKNIVEREALLGVSMTGMMDNPEIAFDPVIQKKGAKIIKKVNKHIAKLIGINASARCTTCKPAGSTSLMLGTSSGIHPHHAKRYFRRIQANINEFPLQHFESINPTAVEDSVWSNTGTDKVVVFLCEVPTGAITKNQISALEMLENVKSTQQNWIEYGTNEELCVKPFLRHNISNTITVKPEEWVEVRDYIFKNRKYFTGISLLAISGDKDLPQTPFTTVYTLPELYNMYGDGVGWASGLIVHALRAFDGNLWKACDYVIGNLKLESPTDDQSDLIRRVNKFSNNYNLSVREVTYLMKDVNNLKKWVDLKRDYKEIDWSDVHEESPFNISVDTTAGAACAGGACEII